MRILFLGDVVGSVGRQIINDNFKSIKEKYSADLTIINGENAAHGKGITTKIYRQFKNLGIDAITLGNHAFSKSMIIDNIDDCSDLIRPCNMEPLNIGNGYIIKEVKGLKILVINVCGQVFMDNVVIDPYSACTNIIDSQKADIVFVDFHGEATAEKRCFFEYMKNKATIVCGTHTHIQTADEMIKDHRAFISDVGMCGPIDSILGRDIDEVINKTIYHEKTYFTPADGKGIICGVVIDVDEQTCNAINIERIQIRDI